MNNIRKPKLFSGLFLLFLLLPFGSPIILSKGNAAPPKIINADISTCPMFPANNFWNVPVDALPVHAQSSVWINTIGANTTFHMDFGSGIWDGGPIGIPYNIVSGATKYPFDFYYPDESDAGPYPLPASPKIEWGGDHHILTVDTADCTLYEIYDASKVGGNWFGGSGAIWDLNSNALRTDEWTSADAAGLPILPGLVRYDEAAAAAINHALRFTSNCTADYHIWPARHTAQSGSCANPVPFGARFRLKADYDINGYSAHAQAILQAFKTYGIVLADNGSNWYVSGEPNSNWDNDVLHELDALHGNNFEVVDTSALMVDADSAETNSAAFGKSAPGNLSTWVSLTPTLSWGASANATKYEYCVDTSDNNLCDGSWVDNGILTSANIVTPLLPGVTYFWQARAINGADTTYANQSYWSFTTGDKPSAFGKSTPFNHVINQALNLTLKWNVGANAKYYEYCYSVTPDTCDTTWKKSGLSRSVDLRGLSANTAYYWHVRAVNDFGVTYSNNNAWYSFITTTPDEDTFISDSAKDGWMLESREFSNLASTKNAAGNLRVGDDSRKRQYRSLLSFDTANLPNNAVIYKAVVRIKKTDSNPILTTHGDLVADMKKGFFGLSPLENIDFSAPGENINTAGKFVPALDPDWYQITLKPAYFKYISLAGTTQFRLRFTKDDNNDNVADVNTFYDGNDVNAPQFIIEYSVP